MSQRSLQVAGMLAALVLCVCETRGQDFDRLLPSSEQTPGNRVELPSATLDAGHEAGEVLIESLEAVDLIGEISVPNVARLRAELAEGVGQTLTTGGLLGLMDQIIAHYERHDFPVVEVFLPEQEITSGRVQLEVVEGTVGEVAIAGGSKLGVSRIGIRSGDKLTMGGLQSELDWLNRNRFADARLAVAPGGEVAVANLLFQLSDQRPLRVFGGFENSGVEVVGEERFFGGFEWGNAFGLGHRMIYQATVGTDIDAFRAHALDYRLPLAWRHELALQAAIVNSEALLEEGIQTGGTSWLLGAHYTVPLKRFGDWRHEVSAGFDFKSTDNNLEFGGVEVFSSAAEVAQLVGRYSASFDRGRTRTALLAEAIYSPGDLTGANSDEAFRGIRGDAVSDYYYFRGQVSHVRPLVGDSSLVLRAGGQWTDEPLLPSEQLALSGHDRVRGYGERDVLGDRGYWASAEIRVPVMLENLQVLGFVDYGKSFMQGGVGGTDLLSAGPGLRYRFGDHASLRFDFGWQLDRGGSNAHLGLQFEF